MSAPLPRKTAAAPAKRTAARPSTAKPAAKRDTKSTEKPVVKTPGKRAAPAPAPAKAVESSASAKPRKTKLVRDSFTIPKEEYAAIDALKQRAAQAGRTVRKSELLRAGLMALTAMDTVRFLAAITAVPLIKTGRPKAG